VNNSVQRPDKPLIENKNELKQDNALVLKPDKIEKRKPPLPKKKNQVRRKGRQQGRISR